MCSSDLGMQVHHMACAAINDFGTEEQKKKYLVPLAQGETMGCVAPHPIAERKRKPLFVILRALSRNAIGPGVDCRAGGMSGGVRGSSYGNRKDGISPGPAIETVRSPGKSFLRTGCKFPRRSKDRPGNDRKAKEIIRKSKKKETVEVLHV